MAKKDIALIIGMGKPGHSEPDGDEDPKAMRRHMEDCVKEFFEAGRKGDWKAAAEALHAFDDLCEAAKESGEYDRDEDEADEEEESAEDEAAEE